MWIHIGVHLVKNSKVRKLLLKPRLQLDKCYPMVSKNRSARQANIKNSRLKCINYSRKFKNTNHCHLILQTGTYMIKHLFFLGYIQINAILIFNFDISYTKNSIKYLHLLYFNQYACQVQTFQYNHISLNHFSN